MCENSFLWISNLLYIKSEYISSANNESDKESNDGTHLLLIKFPNK